MFEIMLSGDGGGFVSPFPSNGDFKGEIPSSSFITGTELASAVNLTAGYSQHPDTNWLKFIDSVDGKTKYIPKMPIRYNILWKELSNRGLITGTLIRIKGLQYKVRLFKGSKTDPSVDSTGMDNPSTYTSEWNRLMYRIVNRSGTSGEGIIFGEWAQYTETDVGMGLNRVSGRNGYGFNQWCQEAAEFTGTKVTRGNNDVTGSYRLGPTYKGNDIGWRPVLELA